MCFPHWKMVPRKIQQAVWATYRRGQCEDKRPSLGWHEAASAAIGYVATKDKQPLTVSEVKALRALGYETTTDGRGELVVRPAL
jgi:hypothetical protein